MPKVCIKCAHADLTHTFYENHSKSAKSLHIKSAHFFAGKLKASHLLVNLLVNRNCRQNGEHLYVSRRWEYCHRHFLQMPEWNIHTNSSTLSSCSDCKATRILVNLLVNRHAELKVSDLTHSHDLPLIVHAITKLVSLRCSLEYCHPHLCRCQNEICTLILVARYRLLVSTADRS